jgi:hypothetical protein
MAKPQGPYYIASPSVHLMRAGGPCNMDIVTNTYEGYLGRHART